MRGSVRSVEPEWGEKMSQKSLISFSLSKSIGRSKTEANCATRTQYSAHENSRHVTRDERERRLYCKSERKNSWLSHIRTATWLDLYCVASFYTIQLSEWSVWRHWKKLSHVTVKIWETRPYHNTSPITKYRAISSLAIAEYMDTWHIRLSKTVMFRILEIIFCLIDTKA